MTPPPGTRTAGDRTDRAEDARNVWRESRADKKPLSGAALGRMFERSERWGRDRIAEVRAQDLAQAAQDMGPADQVRGPAAGPSAGYAASPETGAAPAVAVPSATVRLPGSPPTAAAFDTAIPPPEPPAPQLQGAQASAHDDGLHRAGMADSDPRAARASSVATEPPTTNWVWWCALAAVVVVGAVALATSYDHMRVLAHDSGEGWRAWMLPVSVDGLMIAASVTILARRRAGERGGWLAWSSLCGGVTASVAANVAAAEPNLVAQLVAAWPPLAALARRGAAHAAHPHADRDQPRQAGAVAAWL